MTESEFRLRFFDVIANGDIDSVTQLAITGMSIFNNKNVYGPNAYLVKKDNILDKKDEKGMSALMYASMLGKKEVVEFLLKQGAKVNLCDNNGRTALIYASKNGYYDVVRILVTSKADVNMCTKQKFSALHYAAMYGHDKVANLLVINGANVYLRDNRGHTPMIVSSSSEVRRAIMDGVETVIQNRVKNLGVNKALLDDKKRRGR